MKVIQKGIEYNKENPSAKTQTPFSTVRRIKGNDE